MPELEKEGQSIGLRDTFIAAIALTRHQRRNTNKEHFNRIVRLKIHHTIDLAYIKTAVAIRKHPFAYLRH